MSIVHATDATLQHEISSGVVVVDFWAPWCGPCKRIAPALDQLASTVKIVKVDVDQNPESSGKYGIMSLPTLVIFNNGEPVEKVVGANIEELKAAIFKIQ